MSFFNNSKNNVNKNVLQYDDEEEEEEIPKFTPGLYNKAEKFYEDEVDENPFIEEHKTSNTDLRALNPEEYSFAIERKWQNLPKRCRTSIVIIGVTCLTAICIVILGIVFFSTSLPEKQKLIADTVELTPSPPPPSPTPDVDNIELSQIAKFVARELTKQVMTELKAKFVHKDSVDWRNITKIAKKRIHNVHSLPDVYPIVSDVVGLLNYPHTKFLNPMEADDFNTKLIYSIGIEVILPDFEIYLIYPKSPAAQASLKLGDKIFAINGQSTTYMTAEQFSAIIQENKTKADPEEPPTTTPNTFIRLEIYRNIPNKPAAPAQSVVIDVTPAYINKQLLPEQAIFKGSSNGLPIGYLELFAVANSDPQTIKTYETVAQDTVIETDWVQPCGFIIDLRRNTGGPLYPMLSGVAPLLGEGIVGEFTQVDGEKGVSIPWRQANGIITINNVTTSLHPFPPEQLPLKSANPPVAILLSHLTADGAEALAVAFKHRHNTKFIGSKTAGFAANNNIIPFQDGSLLFLTTALDKDRNGNTYEFQIEPDVQISFTDIANYRDKEKDKAVAEAIKWIQTVKSCTSRSGITTK